MVVARCLVSFGFGILGDAGRSMIVQKTTFQTSWLGSFEKQLPLLFDASTASLVILTDRVPLGLLQC